LEGANGRRQCAQELAQLLHLIGNRAGDHLRQAEAISFWPRGRLDVDLARFFRYVQQDTRQCDRSLPIDGRVMQLRVHRHPLAAVLGRRQTFEYVELPERLAAIEQHGVQFADHLLEFFQLTALGQADLDDVLVQIRLGVDPGRVGELERHPPQPAPQRRHHRQALGNVAPQIAHELAFVAGGQFEQMQSADVHRHLGGLEVKERRIEPG